MREFSTAETRLALYQVGKAYRHDCETPAGDGTATRVQVRTSVIGPRQSGQSTVNTRTYVQCQNAQGAHRRRVLARDHPTVQVRPTPMLSGSEHSPMFFHPPIGNDETVAPFTWHGWVPSTAAKHLERSVGREGHPTRCECVDDDVYPLAHSALLRSRSHVGRHVPFHSPNR